MNRSEFVAEVAAKGGMSKKDADIAVKAVFDVITDTLKKGDKVSLVGFGTFEAKQRKARKGLNPMTKQTIDIPASKAPSFKAGKALKDELN